MYTRKRIARKSTNMICDNCKQEVVAAQVPEDGAWYWMDSQGRNGCVYNPVELHPCGGTYILEDFHCQGIHPNMVTE